MFKVNLQWNYSLLSKTDQDDLKRMAIRGGVWNVVAQAVRLVCQLGSTIVLARLLLPEDFGIVASLVSFVALISGLRDLGLATAIVQAEKMPKNVLNTLFGISVILSTIFVVIIICSGKFVSWLVSDSRVFTAGCFLSIGYLFIILETVPLGLLRRGLKFKQIALRDIAIAILSIVVSITIAYAGGGYLALVIPLSLMPPLSLVLSFQAAKWRPSRDFSSWKEARTAITFGGTIAISTIANRITQNIDQTLLGKYVGLTELGYYSRGKALLNGTLQQALGPVASVMIPVLSRLRDDRDRLQAWLDKLSMLVVVFAAPASALLLVSAEHVVSILLGPQWSHSAPVFRILSLGVFLMSYGGFLYWVLVATGNAKTLMKSTWIGSVVTITAIIVGLNWGAVGVAVSTIGSGIFIRALVLIHSVNSTGRVRRNFLMPSYLLGVMELFSWIAILYPISIWLKSSIAHPVWYLIVISMISAALLLMRLVATAKGRELVKWGRSSLLSNLKRQKAQR